MSSATASAPGGRPSAEQTRGADGSGPGSIGDESGKSVPDELVGATIAEKFRIVGIIGEGAMGKVYRAPHLTLDRPIAIKVLHNHLSGDERVARRFHREARAASRLAHPNSLHIIDFGTSREGTLYIAMDDPTNEDALRVVASCEELSLVDDESGVPRSPNETMTSLIREQVPLSKTPGGEPVAFVTEESGCPGSVVLVEQHGSSALVRVYLDQLVAYGWVDGSALAPPAASAPPMACGFGMIGILSAGGGPSPENRAPRHVCKRPMELFARKGSKPVRVGRLTQESCLRAQQGKQDEGFVAIELDGRVSVEVAPKPGVSFLVTEADWAGCAREEPSDGPVWGRCD